MFLYYEKINVASQYPVKNQLVCSQIADYRLLPVFFPGHRDNSTESWMSQKYVRAWRLVTPSTRSDCLNYS